VAVDAGLGIVAQVRETLGVSQREDAGAEQDAEQDGKRDRQGRMQAPAGWLLAVRPLARRRLVPAPHGVAILPHALRLILPPLTTEFLTIFKNSSVAMTIGVAETTFMSYKIDSETFHGLEATTGAMFIYLVLGMVVVKTMSFIETKFRIHGLVGR
jgi:glutamate/aspartate transport system permease protein